MSDSIISPDQIVGKTLFAQTRINVRNLPSTTAKILRVTTAGENVGVVFSYVLRDGKYWWQLDEDGSKWVQHNAGWYSLKLLKDQGALTVKEVEAAKKEQEKSLIDKLKEGLVPGGTILKYGVPILILGVGFMVADRFLPKKQK